MATDPQLLPPVSDRRSPDRRSRLHDPQERAEALRNAALIAAAVCGGLAALFVFFVAIGSVNIGDAAVATIVAVLLAGAWGAGYQYKRRHADLQARRHDRERRGF